MLFGHKLPFGKHGNNALIEDEVLNSPPKLIKDSSYSKECKDIIQRLLTKNDKDRLGHEPDNKKVSDHPWFTNVDQTLLVKPDIALLDKHVFK